MNFFTNTYQQPTLNASLAVLKNRISKDPAEWPSL